MYARAERAQPSPARQHHRARAPPAAAAARRFACSALRWLGRFFGRVFP
jgi:hypothetical protein